MKNLKRNIFIFLMALLLVFLDVYFFSFLSIRGISILSSFLVLIIFSLLLNRDYIVLALSMIIFLTIFSSLNIFILFLLYLILPTLVVYLRKKYLPEPSVLYSFFYFLFLTFLVGICLMFDPNQISADFLLVALYFSGLNTIFGVIFFALTKKILSDFPQKKITF